MGEIDNLKVGWKGSVPHPLARLGHVFSSDQVVVLTVPKLGYKDVLDPGKSVEASPFQLFYQGT